MADEPRTPGTGGAEDNEGPKREAGSLTWLWMILALLSVGGFLTWLGMVSEPTSVAVVETTDEEDAEDFSVRLVPKDTLAANKARYEGQEIRVHNVEATGELGEKIFWGELGDLTEQVPLLVRMDSAAAAGFTLQNGALYTVTGTMNPMSDSLADAWGEAGEFAGEGEQMQAAFTDYYIQVRRIRPTPRSELEGGSGSGSGGGQGDQDTSSEGATADTGTSG